MTLGRRFAVPLLVAALLAVTAGAAKPSPPPAPAETKSTTAHPVRPPETPAVPSAPDTPDTPEPPDSWSDQPVQTEIGEDVTIRAGETHEGDVVCVRGHAVIDGHVKGHVTVVMGKLDVSGTVNGNVTAVLSEARLNPGAKVGGELVNIGGSLSREGANVARQVVNLPFGLDFADLGRLGMFKPNLSRFFTYWKLFFLFLFFVCALLMAALVPDRIRTISEETPAKLVIALFYGLLGYVALGITQIFLCVTVIGIPVAIILYLAFVVLKWMAMTGVFHHVGQKIGRAFGREMSLLGAIFLGFLPFAVLRMAPLCIGYLIWFAVEILGFGLLLAVFVFHGQRRPTVVVQSAPPPAAPPAAPVAG